MSDELLLIAIRTHRNKLYVFIFLTVVSVFIFLNIKYKYSAEALVYADQPELIEKVLKGDDIGYHPDADNMNLSKISLLLKSAPVLDSIIKKNQLDEYYNCNPSSDIHRNAIKQLSEAIKISFRDYNTISIVIEDKDPEMALKLVNDLLHYFNQFVNRKVEDNLSVALQWQEKNLELIGETDSLKTANLLKLIRDASATVKNRELQEEIRNSMQMYFIQVAGTHAKYLDQYYGLLSVKDLYQREKKDVLQSLIKPYVCDENNLMKAILISAGAGLASVFVFIFFLFCWLAVKPYIKEIIS